MRKTPKPRMKQMLSISIRPKIRLSEIEKLIKRHRIIVPPLSRATLIRMCEEGAFERGGDPPTGGGGFVSKVPFGGGAGSVERGGRVKKGEAARWGTLTRSQL